MLVPQSSEEEKPNWYVNLTSVAISTLLIFALWRFMNVGAALSAAACLIANILVVSFHWNQRRKAKFWVIVGSLVVAQFLVGLTIHWPAESALRLALFGVVVVDALITLCILRVLES